MNGEATLNLTSNCLRCRKPCRRGTPDLKKRAILQSATTGFCPNCMITRFLLGIEPIRDTIEGLGPEIFLDIVWREKVLRPVMQGVLAYTQMPEDAIDWIEVVRNWEMPWPKGRKPNLDI